MRFMQLRPGRSASLAVLLLLAASSRASAATPPSPKAPAKPEKPLAKPGDDEIMADDPPAQAASDKPAEGSAGQKSGPKVLLVPFQPIFRSVAANKIQTANELVQKELDH